MLEKLEDRQLLSCTIDLRVQATGGKTATVTAVGQQVTLVAYAQISGTPASGADDGFQSVAGSFLSNATASGAVAGNLSATLVPAYTANGSQVGTVQDLNGDGNLDVGSNDNADIAGFWNARAGSMQTGGFASGNYTIFPLGLVTYTVTKLNNGVATDVNFRVRDIVASAYEAVWQEGGQGLNDTTGTLLTGAPVVISDGAAAPTGSISGSVTANGTGLNAVQVYIDANNSGTLTASDIVTSTTSNGSYTFSGLAAGTYVIREVPPNGYSQTSPSGGAGISVALATSSTAATGENFTDSVAVVSNASIAGTVSKVVSGATSGFSGVTVDLDNSGGTLITSTTTGSTGTYSFGSLAAGSYSIKEVVPSGYTQTTPSGAIAVTLSAGQAASGENFTDTASTVASNASIAGTVSHVVSGTTSAFPGVTVDLDNSGGTLITATTTGSNGAYSFTALAAGSYLVKEIVPSGYTQTSPAGSIPVTLAAGQVVTGENFTDTATSTTTTLNQLTGTVFGTAGSYANSGNTIAKAVDGNLSTFFDGPTANGNVVGLDLGSAQTISEIKYASRSGFASRMNGGIFEASNSPTFASGNVVLYTIPAGANPSSTTLTAQTINVSGTYRYVEYISPNGSYGDISEFQVFGPGATGPVVNQYFGSVFGTAGSYNNDGNTIAKAVDGSLSTFFDGPTANGDIVGLDLGSAEPITEIKYASRSGFASRMNGGIFEASNSATFASGNVILYTIPSGANPSSTSLTTQNVTVSGTYRYVEYIAPAGSYGDISEFQVFGTGTAVVKTPLTGTVFGTAGSYQNDGNTIAKAVDGNTATFFDGPTANGNIVGLALSSASTISSIAYTARSGFESRMVGGYFQASNSSTFASGNVTLYTITAAPASGQTVTVNTGVTGTYLYVRYVSPNGSYGDIAEMSFFA